MFLYINARIEFSVRMFVLDDTIHIMSRNDIIIKRKHLKRLFELTLRKNTKTYYKILQANGMRNYLITFNNVQEFLMAVKHTPIYFVYNFNDIYKKQDIMSYKEMNELLKMNVYKKNQYENIYYSECLKLSEGSD